MHRLANRFIPGIIPFLCHMLVLTLGAFRPRMQICGRRFSHFNQMAVAPLVALAGMTSQAMALDWVDPSITIAFVPDDRCIAGLYESAAITRVAIAWHAMNTDIEPVRGINLTGWNERVTNWKDYGFYENVPVGQLPLQTTLASAGTGNLIEDTFLYVCLVDSWQTSSIRNQDRSRLLSAKVTAPNYGASGETRKDMTTDPDCTPCFITGTLSTRPDGGPKNVTLTNNTIIDVSEVPNSEFVFAYARDENGGGGALRVTGATSIHATNTTIHSDEPSGTSAAGFLVVPRLRPAIAGPISGTFGIPSNNLGMPTPTFTVIGTGVDTTSPTVTWIARNSPAISPTDSETASWQLRYSKGQTDVSPDDFQLFGSTASLSVSGSANTYEVAGTGDDLSTVNGTVELQHAAKTTMVYSAGNALVDFTPAGQNDSTFELVNVPPTFSAQLTPNTIGDGIRSRLWFVIDNTNFSSAVTELAVATNFSTGHLVAPMPDMSNTCVGTLSAASGSNLIPLTSGSVAGSADCEFAANIVSERGRSYDVGPGPIAINQSQLTACPARLDVLNISPSMAISPLVKPGNGTYTAHLNLREASTDFVGSDLTLTNATSTLAGPGTHFTAALTSLADGPITLYVAADCFTALAGNANTSSIAVTAVHDGTSPPVAIRKVNANFIHLSQRPSMFSEPVTCLFAALIAVTNIAASSLDTSSAPVYTALIQPITFE